MNQYLPIPPDKSVPETPPEKLITIKEAADTLGLPAWTLSRAAAQGVFPTYRLLNSRRLVKLSEVLAAVEASRRGGDRS
jgi:excisionase family DNA binding protein